MKKSGLALYEKKFGHGALAEFFNFDESRPKSELTAEINEAQPQTLLKTSAKN